MKTRGHDLLLLNSIFICLAILSPLLNQTARASGGFLLNLDLGTDGGQGVSQEKGFAAVGVTANDFWNFYDMSGRSSGTVTNLDLADGTATPMGVSVSDAAGVWSDYSTDPMYHTYVYPLDHGNDMVTFTNLPTGQYDVLAYSVDGNFDLGAGEMETRG
jgi:hypothetical protein